MALQPILERFLKLSSEEGDSKEMTFLEHLEELRWQIIKGLAGFLVATVVCIIYADFLVNDLLMKPLHNAGLKAQVLAPYGKVMLYMDAILMGAFIISMPNTVYWLWKFVAPGLMPKEKRYISRIVILTSLCFFVGVVFGYIVLIPAALTFFATFGSPDIALNISIDHYVSFILALILGSGLVFELPMISYFLTKMGLLTPAFMRHYRRHAIVVILIIAAVITPTPDMVTQVLMALPMFVLYEVSILVCALSLKKKVDDTVKEDA
ncbi:MAG TPA: twin-arginine translocase subunit TatC [Bacteroidota bacterium]|nr:twin-arginine translocase subunit TatC [Bacteroidota bacterium]